MYKSFVIPYNDNTSKNKAVLFIDKNRYYNSFFWIKYIVVILLVFRKIKILY